MPLTTEQEEYLNAIFDYLDEPGKMTEWETAFMKSQKERYDQYGLDTRVSPKQWNVIHKVGKKLGLDRPDGDEG